MGTRTPTFAELVGDEREFFTTYFARRPLFRPGALPGDMSEILSIADLDDIVHQEGLRSSLFRMLGPGTGAAGPFLTKRLHLRREGQSFEDALSADKVYAHFRTGKTLIHAGLNHTRPNLRALCGLLTEKFAAPSEAVAFLTPAGQQGTGAHSDPSDVYVIQLAGTKRWRVWPTPGTRRVGEDRAYVVAEMPEPVLDVSLRPGDVLYLPYGTPHVAVAEGEVSLHLTLVALTSMWSQLISRVLETVLAEDSEFWDVPYAGDPPETLAAALAGKVKALTQRLDQVDLTAALQRVMSAGRAYEGVVRGRFFQDMAAVDHIGADTVVAAVPDSAAFNGAADGGTLVTIAGNKLTMAPDIASALAAAGTGAPFRAGDFLHDEDTERSVSSVKQLVRLGALKLVGDGSTTS